MKLSVTRPTLIAIHHLTMLLLAAMLIFAVSYWSTDVYKNWNLQRQTQTLREEIWEAARDYSARVEQFDLIIAKQSLAIKSQSSNNQATIDQESAYRPRVEDTVLPSKIQLLGVLEVELSEATSWNTVFKMIAAVLITLLGVKIINHCFRCLDQQLTADR